MYREIIGNYKIGDILTKVSPPGALTADVENGMVFVHDGVTPGGLTIGGPRQVSTHLTSAQLLASGTPIQILPAPGPNKLYIVEQCFYVSKFGTVAYTYPGGTTPGLWYGTSVSADGGDMQVFAGSLSQATATISYTIYFGAPIPLQDGVTVNVPLNYWVPGGNLTNGDGTGTITIKYSILTV